MPTKTQPTLRFPEFEGDWEKDKISKIAEVSSGGTPNRSKDEYWNGKIPWVSTTLIDFNLINSTNEYITEEGLKNSSAKIFPEGTILIAMYGQGKTRGKVSILGIDSTTNQACGAIITKRDRINNFFLFQILSSRYEEIRDLSNQGGQQNLSIGIIKDILINFPSLPEQTKIATFLTALDSKLSQLTEKKTLLEQYKKGVMQQLFSQELRFQDDAGDDFPEWEEKCLGEIGNFQTSSVDKLIKDDEKEVYLVNYMNVYRHEKINNDTIKHFDIVTAKDSQIITNNLKKGDILFTPSSETPTDIGHSVVIFEDIENAVYSYHLLRFRPNVKIDILFSHYFCNTEDVLKQLSRFSTGSTRFTISTGNFAKVEIKLPSLKEQTKIANFLSAIDSKIDLVTNQIQHTQQFKKGLLQQLFV